MLGLIVTATGAMCSRVRLRVVAVETSTLCKCVVAAATWAPERFLADPERAAQLSGPTSDMYARSGWLWSHREHRVSQA